MKPMSQAPLYSHTCSSFSLPVCLLSLAKPSSSRKPSLIETAPLSPFSKYCFVPTARQPPGQGFGGKDQRFRGE